MYAYSTLDSHLRLPGLSFAGSKFECEEGNDAKTENIKFKTKDGASLVLFIV